MTPDSQGPSDPLALKRVKLADLMSERNAPSIYSADMPEIRSLPEPELDRLLAYYGGSQYVS